MRSNSKLLFVGVLVFLFPVLFVVIIESIYSTAKSNVDTMALKRVGTLHDALGLYISEAGAADGSLTTMANRVRELNSDITEVRIVERTAEGLVIKQSAQSEKIGTLEKETSLYDAVAFAKKDEPIVTPFTLNEVRMWQAVRVVQLNDGRQFFILTEHSFEMFDGLMKQRLLQSYFGLSAIFVFLIVLAYWISRQTDWQRRHDVLDEKMKERDLFTNMIAHEFRTPLTAINGYTSFLAESKTLSNDEQRYVSTIQLSTARLLALVNDFLEVARIQSGRMELDKKVIDVQTVITDVVDVLKETAKEKRLTLTYMPLAVPISYNTDAKRLHQVIQNIISNSIKYTHVGGVEVTTEVTPLTVSIRIKDTGMGISGEDQQKLFAPFARVGGVEKTTITGTGLGMWITKQLVEILGGTITVESIKGVGTHVVITLKR
jgi:signal transduction histidine kinase